MKRSNNLLVLLSVFLIRKVWHGTIGKGYNKKRNVLCRFYPSCSTYGIMALNEHGFFKGWFLSFKRIKRCNLDNTESCVDYPQD